MPKKTSTVSPVLPWKTRILLSFVTVGMYLVRRRNGTINRRLLNMFYLKNPTTNKPQQGIKTTDITIDSTRNLWFRLFIPTIISSDVVLPVIIFFHGGGFAFLNPDFKYYDNVCRGIACNTPAVVISINYRLSPEHRLPSQYDDGFDSLKFLDETELDGFPANADLSMCFLAGDSAGANLAHNVAYRAGEVEFRRLKVIGQISIQPFFGGEERTASEIRLANGVLVTLKRTDWLWKVFLPEGENRDHEAVNVTGPRAVDIRGVKYPETMVVVGGFDPLQDRQREFYDWLKRSGKEVKLIEYPNAIHAFYLFPELPEASQFMQEAKDFVHHVSAKFSK
ncbi:hypothetical protein NE237_028682 [Protea cynaroides]|uniref:Alpha/beta hydrolase fold-3 domain-containing protein n=1 Tax=Protea cynaroides TaxID=273540 RepID=A0A9Q0GSV5_9MAGN|nr:hypothetical protein NE237_028682 [Protea cynaroides]